MEHLAFDEVSYWDELLEVMDWTQTNVHSTFGVCWGGMAMIHYFHGVAKHLLDEKLVGCYRHANHAPDSCYLRGFSDDVVMPVSRWTEMRREEIEAAGLPNTQSAHMGAMKGEERDAAAAEAARTVPPREHGGNCDIKDLSRGAMCYFPVYVEGGGLSMGDLHFSQGDGEITFCGAIEMAGWLHIKVTLIKEGMTKYAIRNPIFKPSPITPKYDDYLIFEGISVDESGEQHYLDVHVAYRQACLNAIDYLKKFGYSGAQAYAILGTAPVQGHISGVVDIPNACATLSLPNDIFEWDMMPNATGPSTYLDGSVDIPLAPDL